MDEFGYLSVLLSIILGLAVTQILVGMRGCLLTRHRVRWFWPVQWWGVFFLLVCTQTWWSMFGLRYRHEWKFGDFAVLLAQVIFLYLIAGLIYPDFSRDEEFDLRVHFFQQRRHFFALCVLLLLTSIGHDLILNHAWPEPLNFIFQGGFIVFALTGFIFAAEWYHKVAVVLVTSLFVCYVVLLFTRLQ